MNFSRLSIASVDNKQHSSDFHCKENDWFWVAHVHPGLITSDYGVHEVGANVESSMSSRPQGGRCAFKVLTHKPTETRPLGKVRRR